MQRMMKVELPGRRKTSEEVHGCSEGLVQRVGVTDEDAGVGGGGGS